MQQEHFQIAKTEKEKKNIYGHSMQVCHLYKNKHRHSVTNKRGPYELFRLKNCTKSSNLISMFSLTLLATPHSRCYATHAFFLGNSVGCHTFLCTSFPRTNICPPSPTGSPAKPNRCTQIIPPSVYARIIEPMSLMISSCCFLLCIAF